ncbi:MAG: patatin-like phospholipase family protein [Lachnospiraceae bacterium]|nr:patatin-like phospholipase family protein [Lachnospiraceae bacterium]
MSVLTNMPFDFEKEYGVVLEGGGAKGSYQIGVWKAMQEYGVKIRAVAGVSVGALNGALMCMGDLQKAEDIWKTISFSDVMDVDDEIMRALMDGKLKDIDFREAGKHLVQVLGNRGLDISPLRRLIADTLQEDIIRQSPTDLFIGTFDVMKMSEVEININDIEEGTLADYLIASASLPVFKNELLQGRRYLDGGMVNNVPINLLIDRGYKDIIVIRIFGTGHEKRVDIPEDVNIIEIKPSVNLGNMLNFNSKIAQKNMNCGYYDGIRLFEGLAGQKYYIRTQENSERHYMERLIETGEWLKEIIVEDYLLSEEKGSFERQLFEIVFPSLAIEQKLGRDWDYRELYFQMLEVYAQRMHIQKYKVYTEEELAEKVKNKIKDKLHI